MGYSLAVHFNNKMIKNLSERGIESIQEQREYIYRLMKKDGVR